MMQPAATLHLSLPPAAADQFSILFSIGVGIKTTAGISLSDLLCRQLAIPPEYVDQRIQTIFLNHRAVDRTEQVTVPAGAVLALSAAMPGLVGATFRKGGALADFRKDISYVNSPASPQDGSHEATLITLKLFNLVARELGPHLLTKGVWVDDRSLVRLIPQISPYINIENCQWNGYKIPPALLSGQDWPHGWIDLRVAWQPTV